MSENELIEFKDRSNFDFLRFRYAQDYEQRELKADCERVARVFSRSEEVEGLPGMRSSGSSVLLAIRGRDGNSGGAEEGV